jgi:glucose dehydrogenase
MATLEEKFAAAKKCCREAVSRKAEQSREFFKKMFQDKSEVFVIKLDKETGKYVGKFVCCADSPA